MSIIEIEGMEFYAYHGHYEEERIIGNRFLLDLRIEADCEKPAISDNIKDAVNYQTAYKVIREQMNKKSHLLENIAKRILDALYENLEGIKKAQIKVQKMNPPMGGQIKSVSITMEK
ncbi:MAG: dihydroneopterin aldolase [Bacteroidales bacterium]|nr:dihydroneopterin aldolase [Bacteroidales bacterium]MBN2757779.1 dihydroneopterin aldolase [Bacteroidales bacterium]